MNLLNDIRNRFSWFETRTHNLARELKTLPEEYPGWALKLRNEYAVAIEIDPKHKVNESFSQVKFYTDTHTIDGEIFHFLILSTNKSTLLNEFAGVCTMFLEPGENGAKRKEIIKEPINWWTQWKHLLGNRSIDNSVQGIVGELIFFYYLKQKYSDQISLKNWSGPLGGSQDFEFNGQKFEVRSSLTRYSDSVTISSQFQLKHDDRTNLIFVRLEEILSKEQNRYYFSINSLINQLVNLGEPLEDLNSYIERLGVQKHSQDRATQFELLEIRNYPINNDFPVIHPENITNPSNILQVAYTISLSGLTFETLKLKNHF